MPSSAKRLDPSGDFDLWTRSANAEVSPLPATATEWRNRLAGPKANTLPFDHDPPDAADINVTLLEEPDRRTPPKASCATGAGLARVFAVVHNRDVRPLAASEVAVFVLRTKFKGRADLIDQTQLPASWPERLRDDLTEANPGGWLTGSDWAYLDPTKPFRRPLRPVDQREAQVVEFEVPAAAWPAGDWLLMTVVVADRDPIATTERDPNVLVRSSRHVAARSVHRVAS